MGNADLRTLAAIESVELTSIAGSTIAIDAHNWLYRYLTTVVRFTNSDAYTTADGTEFPNLIGIVQGLPRLLEIDVTPIFVFDGTPSQLKADEIAARRAQRSDREEQLQAARETGDSAEIARLESQTQRLTDPILRSSRELLRALDIPTVDAPADGEAQAAYMAQQPGVNAVGSEDYDALLFGAPVTYRDLTSDGPIERMELQQTLRQHGISREQLIDIALLCGTDFNDGVHGFGPKTALTAIKEHGSLDAVLLERSGTIPQADRLRSLFLDPPVTDEYTIPETIDPDIAGARSLVIDEYNIAPDEITRGLNRIETATRQAGLDRWT